ncbi:WxL domain-containing protein, partial [Enterococcus faecium]|uniref:WxL domain-containing protein n=1 Tax=Enterococcus faecium TaxID=1352 RepID=UPI003CC5BD4A
THFPPVEPYPGTTGLLTIDHAPDLDFGTIKFGTAKTVYAALQSGTDSTGAQTQVLIRWQLLKRSKGSFIENRLHLINT